MPSVNETEKKKPAAAKSKVTESARQKFERLGGARVSKALAAIESIGKLANKRSYDFTPDDIAEMSAALKSAVNSLENRFNSALSGTAKQAREAFKFKA